MVKEAQNEWEGATFGSRATVWTAMIYDVVEDIFYFNLFSMILFLAIKMMIIFAKTE